MTQMFTGSMVAIVTPMRAGTGPDTALDHGALAELVEFHIEQGTRAIIAVGTTGESATLTEAEHCAVIRRAVTFANGRIPIIAGTGANSTLEAIALTQAAKEAGAAACLLVTPYYNKPTQAGLYEHYKAVAERVAIPQILYNVPGRTACDMTPETVIRLAEIENIIGIKEASSDLSRVKTIRAGAGPDFLLLSGDDTTAREFILQGGDGVISVTANVAPRAMRDLCDRAVAGDKAGAHAADAKLFALHQALFVESNPIPVKWAAHRLGLIQPGIRLPMTWLSKSAEAQLLTAMQSAGVL